MARATRSTLQLDKSPLKLLDSKKRKRTSDSADQPAQKLQRTESIPDAATKPIDPSHAAQILHVLDAIDRKHAFLDRAFPLEQSSNSSPRHSLRTLLSDPNKFALSTLRTAVQNLLPISIHPRASISPTAAEQQRFCDIALSLLDQASFHPISLDIDSLLPQEPPEDDPPSPRFVAGSNKRYALMQSLPGNATYWSSANLPPTSEPATGPSALKDLPTGHAHLVAVFPTPSTSASTSTLPKLGDYARAPVPSYDSGRSKHVAPTAQRRVTCGSFLDYGAFASFAPSWVGNGREIGQRQLGEVYAQRAQRYREKLEARQRAVELQQAALLAAKAAEEKATTGVADDAMESPPPPDPTSKVDSDVDALEDILSPNEIESLKAVLGSLELENAVTELLTRNRRALQRLGQLQVERLRAGKGKAPVEVEEGDEEWDVAHGILSSLTLLGSLRPRSSAHPATPLIPPPAVLHTLHRTLPRAATPGWHGTLPARTSTALRDDTTVKIRAGVAAVPPPAPTPVAAPTAAATATGYYPHFYQTQQAQTTPRPSPMPLQQQQHSQSQQYQQPLQYRFNSSSTSRQQPGYFPANQTPYGYAAATGAWPYGGAYGHSVTPGTQTVPYGGGAGAAVFSANTSGASTPVPMGKAVANTVSGVGKAVVGAQGQWGAGASYGGGTPLPPHLRG
ncbi:hypothetical protein R3P38DRAFT_2676386, partial [Favolaschia claudopus]